MILKSTTFVKTVASKPGIEIQVQLIVAVYKFVYQIEWLALFTISIPVFVKIHW